MRFFPFFFFPIGFQLFPIGFQLLFLALLGAVAFREYLQMWVGIWMAQLSFDGFSLSKSANVSKFLFFHRKAYFLKMLNLGLI